MMLFICAETIQDQGFNWNVFSPEKQQTGSSAKSWVKEYCIIAAYILSTVLRFDYFAHIWQQGAKEKLGTCCSLTRNLSVLTKYIKVKIGAAILSHF